MFQTASAHFGDVTVAAFQTDPGSDSITIVPKWIASRGVYEVRSAEGGVLGTRTGAELLADGLTIVGNPVTTAHWVVLTRIR